MSHSSAADSASFVQPDRSLACGGGDVLDCRGMDMKVDEYKSQSEEGSLLSSPPTLSVRSLHSYPGDLSTCRGRNTNRGNHCESVARVDK